MLGGELRVHKVGSTEVSGLQWDGGDGELSRGCLRVAPAWARWLISAQTGISCCSEEGKREGGGGSKTPNRGEVKVMGQEGEKERETEINQTNNKALKQKEQEKE